MSNKKKTRIIKKSKEKKMGNARVKTKMDPTTKKLLNNLFVEMKQALAPF